MSVLMNFYNPGEVRKVLNTRSNYQNLPKELREHGLFCSWRYESVKGRLTKVPYRLDGRRARSTVRDDFCDFNMMEAHIHIKNSQNIDCGLGLGIFNGFSAIDIDDCVENGKLNSLAVDVINAIDSYTEYSPSGAGIRIIFKAPDFEYDTDRWYINNRKVKMEVYVHGCTNKYVTLTGNVIRPVDVNERCSKLKTILERYMVRPADVQASDRSNREANAHSFLTDEEVLEKAMNGRARRFVKLFRDGDFSDYASQSEADLALCSMLAFWSNGDTDQIDRLFRQSALYRPKWDRKDYSEHTMKMAINGCSEFYEPINRTSPEEDFSDTMLERLKEMRPDSNALYQNTDIGNGRLFADCYKTVARYVPERKCWYCYEGGVWSQDIGNLKTMEYVKELADALMRYAMTIPDETQRTAYIKHCCKWQKRHTRETILKDAQGIYPISASSFDRDPFVFNCLNGTLHLDSMEFTEHKADDLLTKMSGAIYDPEAKSKRFDRFISEVTQDNIGKARFVQKSMGYGMSGDIRHECMFIFYGATTRNGKGTLCESVLGVMGDYGCTSRPETLSVKQITSSNSPSEDVARLAGVRFVNISEPGKGLNLDAAKLKTMTGSDTLNARFLHENSFDFKPQFKLYINTNYLPVVTDMTIFTSGRIIMVPFERHFDEDEQDRTPKTEFAKPENRSAILNWLIEGFRLQQEEGLTMPDEVQRATDLYEKDSDKIRCFAEDCLIPDASAEERTSEVYRTYQSWCQDNGYYAEGMRTFKQSLRSFAQVVRKRPKRGGGATTLLLGYRLVSDFMNPDL